MLDLIEGLDILQPLHGVAEFPRIALLGFPLGLERFIEFAAGVCEAAYEPNAVLLPDSVIAPGTLSLDAHRI